MPSSRHQNSDGPSSLLHTLVAVFSGVLFGLFLSKFKTPPHQSINSIAPNADSEDENNKPRNLPPLQSQIPPSPTNAENTCKCCHHKTPWWKIALEIGVFAATVAAVVAPSVYARITYKMWQGMQSQTKTARQQLELSERPWIKIIDVKTLGNNPLIPAFSFQGFGHGVFPQGTKQATFQLRISMKNIGHSPAFVGADFELFFPAWKDTFEDLIVTEEKRFCDTSAKREVNYPLSRILFPGEPLEWSGAAVQLVGPMINSNTINHSPDDPAGDYVLPVVCANYNFRASPQKYQTRTLYVVVHKATGNRFF
jgi:hypothetical protein